jgi:hypothetical protein
MSKSRKRSSLTKSMKSVDKSLKTVGKTAMNVADASIPIIEKGVSAVYGTMATGLDLGTKGVSAIKKSLSKSRKASRARSLAGGRRRRHRSRRH